MQQDACVAGIGPVEFWDMTFAEVQVAIRAYTRRIEDQRGLFAWLGALVVNLFSKKRYTPAMLMGKASMEAAENVNLKEVRERARTNMRNDLLFGD